MTELKKQHLEMLQLLESIEVMFQNGNSIHPNSIIRGAIQKLIGMEVDVTNVNDKCDNKHTAVEWLIRDVNENIAPLYIPKQVIEQAKAMEKEQIINAFNYAQIDLGMEADEYYEQIFKTYCMPEGLDTPEKHEQYLKDIGLINEYEKAHNTNTNI